MDQYIQVWNSKADICNDMKMLKYLKDGYQTSKYLVNMEDLQSRRNVTRLRLHVCTIKRKGDKPKCNLCNSEDFTNITEHLILDCNKLKHLHVKLEESITKYFSNFKYLPRNGKVKFILDCKSNEINILNFINDVYVCVSSW